MSKNFSSGAPKKARWTASQKSERGSAGGFRGGRDDRGGFRGSRDGGFDRPRRDDRAPREGGYRGSREGGFDRPARSFDRDDRGYRGNRDERAREGGYRGNQGGFDRPKRSFDDRAPREGGYRGNREGGFDRPARSFDRDGGFRGRDDRGGYRGNRDERPREGGYRGNRDERPREGGYRGSREGGFDRPARSFDRDDRGYRGNRDERPREGGYRGNQGGFDRPKRSFDDRAPREGGYRGNREGGYDRPKRSFDDRGDRGGYRGDRDDRGGYRGNQGGFDRPKRSFDDRGDRGFGSDRSRRSDYSDRPVGDVGGWTADHEDRPLAVNPTGASKAVTDDNGFLALGLPRPIVERLARDGITEPFPIQAATIPDALAGKDLLGRGQTGSGKTLSFGLPLITRLAASGKTKPGKVRSIVLVPTRELAMQVSDALQPLVHVMGLRHKLVAGGMPYPPQIDALERGLDVLVATPGRLIDLIERGAADLSEVEVAVLDEADHMAEMGFLEAITEILDLVPAGGQRLLFSATLDRGIDKVADKYLVDPITHETDPDTASVSTMEHHVLLIDPMHKKVITAEVANRTGRTVVFARTKLGADRIAGQLREQGVMAAALHGGLNQSQRNRVLTAFKSGDLPVLVATDVAARGIHVDDVSVVLQVDPPADHKDYLHRSGRTARAGEKGTVVTLALPHQRKQMERLVAEAGVDVEAVKTAPGDSVLYDNVGARTPSGEPVSEARYRKIIDGEPRPARGPRRGGSSYGHKGGGRGFRRDDRRGGGGFRGRDDRGGYGDRRPRD